MLHFIQSSPMVKSTDINLHYNAPLNESSALKGEVVHFQICLWSDRERPIIVDIKDCSNTFNEIYLIKSVPVSFAHFSDDIDSHYISDSPALIPDCLIPLNEDAKIAVGKDPVFLWVSARGRFAGDYSISYLFSSGEEFVKTDFNLRVLDIALQKGRCNIAAEISVHSISSVESIPPFCNVFWERLAAHFRMASKLGVTDVITPLFSSYESVRDGRAPDQLIRIVANNKKYEYNYDALDCWLMSSQREGIKNFTFTAIFPSLISRKCPCIYADGYNKRYLLFDENDCITDEDFLTFVRDFLKNLVNHINKLNLADSITFIITDEISQDCIDVYNECFKPIQKILAPFKIISRAHHFHCHGFIGFPLPIVPIHEVESYLSLPLGPRISFDIDSSSGFMNQLIAAPSMRIRAFGLLGYLYDFGGIFLHHYNCNISPLTGIAFDPFISPEGDGSYPAGSLFMIYNHPNGPYPSIRMMMLRSAIQDSVVLRLLESYVSRDRLLGMIQREIPVTLNHYPIDILKYHKFREKIYDLYEKYLNSRNN